jgi:hypothetical protein
MSSKPPATPPEATPRTAPPAPRDHWEARAVPAALLLLGALFLQGLLFIGESSQTSDEAVHLTAGYSYLKAGDFRLNPEHPPLVKELAALPLLFADLSFPWGPLWEQAEEWNAGRVFVHENRLPNDTILLLGRLPILMLSLGLGWAIFHWGRRLFGARGALLSLALYVLDPNVVAHSCLVTTDLGVTLFMFLSVYALWAWAARPRPARLWLTGLAVGGAFAAKFTALWLLPILGALLLAVALFGAPLPRRPAWKRSPLVTEADGWRYVAVLCAAAGTIAIAAAGVVLATYAFRGAPAYVDGLLMGLTHSSSGHQSYLMGRLSESGWWYYFLFAYLIKTPIGTLVIVLLALAAFVLGRRRPLLDELFLWLPVLLVVVITCFWKVNIGLRHLLPIYPFLYLACGRLLAPTARLDPAPPAAAASPSARPGRRLATTAMPWVVGGLLAWSAGEMAFITPYHLAYFNELIGGPRNGHLYLLDSNLDWGQAARAVRRFQAEQNVPIIYLAYSGNSDPWYYGVVYQYAPGSGNLSNAKQRETRVPEGLPRELFAVTPMVLHSLHFTDHTLYDWLRTRRPIAMPAYAYLVYDITGDVEAHARLSVLCYLFGLPDLAEHEAQRTLRLDPANTDARKVLEVIRQDSEAAAAPDS